MPRPPILPVPDRKAIFESGLEWHVWLEQAEDPSQAEKMLALLNELVLADQTVKKLKALTRPVHVIAIAESWCGDVIRHTPLLMKLASCSANLHVRFITRAQYPDFFARFLTNGGEAIPKYVFCSEEFVEVGNWGPMSSTPRKMIALGKACGQGGEARKHVSTFYNTNVRKEATNELVDLFET